MDRFKLIASVYLFLIRDNKVLLLKRVNTGYEDGNWGLPSGHLEENESLLEATKREVREEIAIDISTKDLELVHLMHRKEKDIRFDFFYTVEEFSGKLLNNEPDKSEEIKWFELNFLPKNTIYYIKLALENYSQGIIYSEVGFD